jgi:hypothetical protein
MVRLLQCLLNPLLAWRKRTIIIVYKRGYR